MFGLIKKIIKIKLFVIGLLGILWLMKKKHRYYQKEK